MNSKNRQPGPAASNVQELLVDRPDHLAERVAELHSGLRKADPLALAESTGATYLAAGPIQGTFHLAVWEQDITLTFPEFVGRDARTGERLRTDIQALLAYYFTLSDGTPLTNRWISFSELPDGKFYTQAFQGYTGHKLGKAIGNDDRGFAQAAAGLNGRELPSEQSLGDQAFTFRVFPYVSLLAVCWLGDDDFPASYRILFDAAVDHHLSTDACAILGSTLTRRLIKNYEQSRSCQATT